MLCDATSVLILFFFNDTATTEIYTLSLHDALPICSSARTTCSISPFTALMTPRLNGASWLHRSRCLRDRKSTRLNSSHLVISYAVFCLKKKSSDMHAVRHHFDSRSGLVRSLCSDLL